MARITRSSSAFGVEIDSLSDIVSFGAAPSFLVYQMSLNSLDGLGILLSSLLMVFGGLRLARFNVQLIGFDKDEFVGLPIPACALTVASFTLNYYVSGTGLVPAAAAVLPWMIVALSLLMVSKVRYDTVPKISRRTVVKEPWKFIFLGLAVVVVFVTGGSAIFPLFVLFIALGIIRYCVVFLRRLTHHHGRYEEDDDGVEPTRIDT